ncbi:hypothetical protein PS943_04410 [Pseudomonas fluorescens]|uniref:Uncharacterized protein n=1 Tax=Pseudomonas fluorescens TaxID=294 RepID=A0A5E7WLS3_PSEFL|nr:hypothetical protein PS943_04410 [Pseudomonas fluorescens]
MIDHCRYRSGVLLGLLPCGEGIYPRSAAKQS